MKEAGHAENRITEQNIRLIKDDDMPSIQDFSLDTVKRGGKLDTHLLP